MKIFLPVPLPEADGLAVVVVDVDEDLIVTKAVVVVDGLIVVTGLTVVVVDDLGVVAVVTGLTVVKNDDLIVDALLEVALGWGKSLGNAVTSLG